MSGAVAKLRDFMKLIRFEHTLFALPYALSAALIAAGGWPPARTLLWILVAMIGARTAAMTFNRLVDRHFDARNPRTAGRLSATGRIGVLYMTVATIAASALFVWAASRLNTLALALAVPTLGLLLGYSLMKRVTDWTHFVLGLALGLSPLGAWVAVRGTLDRDTWPIAVLSAAVILWTAGFDMLYACQDRDFDRRSGLRSVPARLGIGGALGLARLCHAGVPPLLWLAGYGSGLRWIFAGAVAVVAGLLVHEHRLVSATDLSRVDKAFFNVNVTIAFCVLVGTLGDVFLLGGHA